MQRAMVTPTTRSVSFSANRSNAITDLCSGVENATAKPHNKKAMQATSAA